MTSIGWLQIIFFAVVVLLLTKPLGLYMAHVVEVDEKLLPPFLRQFENQLYKLCGVDPAHEMSWVEYAMAMLAVSLISCLFSYLIMRLQGVLPLNPMHFSSPL